MVLVGYGKRKEKTIGISGYDIVQRLATDVGKDLPKKIFAKVNKGRTRLRRKLGLAQGLGQHMMAGEWVRESCERNRRTHSKNCTVMMNKRGDVGAKVSANGERTETGRKRKRL